MQILKRSVRMVAVLMALSGCATLEKNPPKPEMVFDGPASTGFLHDFGRRALASAKPEESAFHFVFTNAEALRWRLALIDHASTSIDLQVFIWEVDESGRLIMDRLIKAAERGVKVRLLIDDIPKGWSDLGMKAASDVPNMSMRDFNPSLVRRGVVGSTLEWAFNFSQLNRRMHNKQMLVDGRWAVLGGRNIGNSYFGLDRDYNFRDVDLLIAGPILSELEASFDLYWNSEAAYPAEAMYRELSEKKRQRLLERFTARLAADRGLLDQTSIPVDPVDWTEEFTRVTETMIPGVAVYMYDEPIVRGDRGKRLYTQLQEFSGVGSKETVIISPYLIPSEEIMAEIQRAVEQGGNVHILTASMDSNNHTMANSHYKKYRKPLLKSGATIREFKGQPGPAMRARSDTAPVEADFISLHIKAFAENRKRVYIGSLNMDPRALVINTENILAIDSPALAEQLIDEARHMSQPENAWSVQLNADGKVRWVSDNETRKHQPARGVGQRVSDWFFRWMPIESQL